MVVHPSKAALAVAAASFGWFQAGAYIYDDEEFPHGCIRRGEAYVDPIPNMDFPMSLDTATACQAACAELSNCTHFAFWPSQNHCWLGDRNSTVTRNGQDDIVSGPKACPDDPPACSEVPTSLFPGAASDTAEIWPLTGYQPAKLQCFDSGCQEIVVLDEAPAWNGSCARLDEVLLAYNETCEAKCRSNLTCSSYQVDVNGTCRMGAGWNCEVGPAPPEAKRFQRGDVRTVTEIRGYRVLGLTMVFDASVVGILTHEDAIRECRHLCYSILECEYWQYSNLTSTGGCWVEGPDSSVAYPLTESDIVLASPDWVAGEYIQRVCRVASETPAPAPAPAPVPAVVDVGETTEESEGSNPWWMLIFVFLPFLCCFTLIGFLFWLCYFRRSRTDKKRARKRGLRQEARQEAPTADAEPTPAPQPVAPQPAMPPPSQLAAPLMAVYSAMPVPQHSVRAPVLRSSPVATVTRMLPVATAAPVSVIVPATPTPVTTVTPLSPPPPPAPMASIPREPVMEAFSASVPQPALSGDM